MLLTAMAKMCKNPNKNNDRSHIVPWHCGVAPIVDHPPLRVQVVEEGTPVELQVDRSRPVDMGRLDVAVKVVHYYRGGLHFPVVRPRVVASHLVEGVEVVVPGLAPLVDGAEVAGSLQGLCVEPARPTSQGLPQLYFPALAENLRPFDGLVSVGLCPIIEPIPVQVDFCPYFVVPHAADSIPVSTLHIDEDALLDLGPLLPPVEHLHGPVLLDFLCSSMRRGPRHPHLLHAWIGAGLYHEGLVLEQAVIWFGFFVQLLFQLADFLLDHADFILAEGDFADQVGRAGVVELHWTLVSCLDGTDIQRTGADQLCRLFVLLLLVFGEDDCSFGGISVTERGGQVRGSHEFAPGLISPLELALHSQDTHGPDRDKLHIGAPNVWVLASLDYVSPGVESHPAAIRKGTLGLGGEVGVRPAHPDPLPALVVLDVLLGHQLDPLPRRCLDLSTGRAAGVPACTSIVHIHGHLQVDASFI